MGLWKGISTRLSNNREGIVIGGTAMGERCAERKLWMQWPCFSLTTVAAAPSLMLNGAFNYTSQKRLCQMS